MDETKIGTLFKEYFPFAIIIIFGIFLFVKLWIKSMGLFLRLVLTLALLGFVIYSFYLLGERNQPLIKKATDFIEKSP